MFKKVLLGILFVVVFVGVGIYIFEILQPARFSNQLSERSKEFIEKQQQQGGISEFSQLIKKPGEDTRGKRIDVNGCFSFVMPFKVFNAREEEECGGYFAFEQPKGSIVVFQRTGEGLSFDTLEGVSFRRQTTDTYKEEKKKIGSHEFLMFSNIKEPYQKTAYYYEGNTYFVLTLTSSGGDNDMNSELESILTSLEFGNKK